MGIVYKLVTDASSGKWNVIPWLLLSDGDGNEEKGLKAEWMTTKDNKLYVGGLGKEWTSVTGEYINDNPMYIKVISAEGSVQHVFWKKVYLKFIPTRGYSSFKFLPGTDEQIIVALRSEEDNGKIATYLTVFDLLGHVLLSDVIVANEKYEGVEFV